MAFSPRTLSTAAQAEPPKLVCPATLWHRGVDELRRRADGRQESGAFLLGTIGQGGRRIEEFLFYNDVDPSCFANGFVEFDGRKLGIVWQRCRDTGRTVVADVHVHPGHYGQSILDKRNPMIAEAGHLAIIVPDYAAGARLPGRIGVYQYLGSFRWQDHSKSRTPVFQVDEVPHG